MDEFELPVGELLKNPRPTQVPARQRHQGQYVILTPVSAEEDIDELYAISHGSSKRLAVWTYMPMSGPFEDKQEMLVWLQRCEAHEDFIFFTVRDRQSGHRLGMLSYVSVVPDQRTLEIGFIWYTPEAQRTKVNTESVFLLLCEAFDRLAYRRVEWKCDYLNERSRAAALRLGFSFEGIARKHRIVNNRNRDTAWYGMTEKEWPEIKNNIKKWLYSGDASLSLTQLNADIVKLYSIVAGDGDGMILGDKKD